VKIDLNLEELNQEFIVRPEKFGDETLYLIFPQHIGCTWTKDNLIFRSSIWSAQGELVSASFKKFFNWGEKSNLVPEPNEKEFKNCYIREKMDGSTLIVSKYKDHLIHRTRGTFDASVLDTGYEIEWFKEKYPNVFDNEYISNGYSILYEWTTPDNRIVIDYGKEPDLTLIGAVKHEDYSMVHQTKLGGISEVVGVEASPLWTFDGIDNMIETVKAFKGREGVCIYFNNGQDIKKLKGIEYLALHAFKGQVSTKNIIALFLEYDRPAYNEFMSKIEEVFDYECSQMALPYVSRICDAYKEVQSILDGMERFVEPLKNKARKEAALAIISAYGKTNRSGYVFKLLDEKELDKDSYTKLLFQTMGETGDVDS